MILRKSILRHVKEKKFQYVGVIILLMVSITLYVSMSMAISTLDKRNGEFKESYHQEDFHFILGNDVDQEQLHTWEKENNLELEKRQHTDVTFKEDATLRLFSITDKVNVPYISEGELPSKKEEIALSPVFAKVHNIEIGDKIEVQGRQVTVTGMMYLPDYIYILERESDILNDPKMFGIGLGQQETINEISNQSITLVLGNRATEKEMQSLKAEVSSNNSLLKWLSSDENPRIQFVESEIESSRAMVTTLPLFILALSVMMVLMIMKRQIETQRKELGTLMALGYRIGELVKHYLTQAAFIGLIGSTLGLTTGALLSLPLTDLYSQYYNLPSISYFDWNIWVLIIGLIIPNLVLLIMTYIVIRKPLTQSPLQLLSPKELMTGKKSFLEKLPVFKKGSFISRFRLRLMVRSKARAVYIFLGVMFSTILLIFGFISYNAMDDLVETTYTDVFKYDYGVYYNTLKSEEVEADASPFTTAEIRIEGTSKKGNDLDQKATIYGISSQTDQINLLNEADISLTSNTKDGFVISKPLAAILGVDVGDSITVTNNFNDSTLTKEVKGVSTIYIGNSIYYTLPKVNDFLGYPSGVYTAKWSSDKPLESADILFVENKADIMKSFESTSALTRNSVVGMAVFAFFIGVVVLTLITNLIVEENSPSISLFKVMGYKDNDISRLVLNVYTPIVLLSYVISVPIAYMSIDQLMKSLVSETGFSLPVNLNMSTIVLSFIIILVTYFVSLYLSKRKLKKVSLQEALKKQQD